MRAPTFILDGSNLAWLGPGEGAALAPIDAIADTLRAEWPGCKVIVVCDASLRHRLDERDRAEHGRRAKAGALVEAPADEDADAYILAAAKQLEACVVTRDLYRDRRAERAGVPMLRPALIGGAVVLGEPKVFASAGDERSTSVDPAALGARVAPGPLPGGAPVRVRGGEDEDEEDDEDAVSAPRPAARGRGAAVDDDEDEASGPRPAARGRRAAVEDDEDEDEGEEDADDEEAPRAPPRPVIRVEMASDPPEEEEFTPHPAAKVGGKASGGTASGGKASGGKASGGKASDGSASGGKAGKGSSGKRSDGESSDGMAEKASRGKAADGKAADGKAGKAAGAKAAEGKGAGGKASGGSSRAGRAAAPSPAPPGQTALGAVILLALLAGAGALVWWLVGGDPAPTPPRDPGVVFVRGCRAWVRAGGEERIAVYVRPGECVTSARALGPERFAATIEGERARVVLVKGDTRTHDFAVAGAPALLAVDARHLLVGGDGEATLYTYGGEPVHRAPVVGAASAEAVAVVLWHGCPAGCGRWRRARGDDALREAVEAVAIDDDAGAPPAGRRFVGPVAIAPDGERFAALVDEGEGAAVLVFGPARGRWSGGRCRGGGRGGGWAGVGGGGAVCDGGEALLEAGGRGVAAGGEQGAAGERWAVRGATGGGRPSFRA
ncbi:MAG: hypothetical protein R3F65_27630 [bacterium]